ncbi:DNA replication/repair protein RecF [Gardnerella sp. DNF01141]|uniref:DNA replication/repair protein RecF n=1 Tax=Gardnerella sp. DNF01141 TaxID=2749057 RepID=UPI003BAC0D2A
MYISRIALDTFRSWNHIIFDCKPGINIIYGNNGLGKTNIVESLEFVGTGISHRTSSTLPLIRKGYEKSTIRLNTRKNDEETTYEVNIFLKGTNRARINNGKSLYMRDILGHLPVVSFTPSDQLLISGDPTVRRTFIDQAGLLLLPNYSQILQNFKHISKQRAALLKSIREFSNNNQPISLSGLEIWTGKFIESGIILTQARQKVVRILDKYFNKIIKYLTNSEEYSELKYNPSFQEVIEEEAEEENNVFNLISEHFQRIYDGELARGCNLIGPHRDDIDFMLDKMLAKDFASNGESWTLAIAAKMALCNALEEKNNEKPIIILDDVFAQLDENRRKQILNFVENQNQVFITTSSLSDIPKNSIVQKNNLINIEDLLSQQNSANNTYEEHNSILKSILEQRTA